MKLKNFDQYFSEMSDSTLVENLYKRNGFQSDAKDAMIKEAIKREIIFSDSDDEISELLMLCQTISNIQDDYVPIEPFKITFVFFYSLSILFFLVGIYVLIMNLFYAFHPTFSLFSIFFWWVSYVFYKFSKNTDMKACEQNLINKAAKPGWIIIGYLASITGIFFVGMTISNEYNSCKKEDDKVVSYRYDEKTRKHGRNMFIISIAILVISIGYWIVWLINKNL